MTAIYLAGPYAARALINGFAAELRTMLFDVTSSWLDETVTIGPGTTGAAVAIDDTAIAKHANDDLDDIANADILVLITAEVAGVDGTSGGRHVETGFALANNLPIIVVGQPENVFHRLGPEHHVHLVRDWPAAVRHLADVASA